MIGEEIPSKKKKKIIGKETRINENQPFKV